MSGFTLNTLKRSPGSRKRRHRVGRGRASGKGKTCGKGHKGQMSRKGNKHKPGFEGGQMKLVRRIPKRGFTSMNKKIFVPVNVSDLSQFSSGTVVTASVLEAAGVAQNAACGIKILGCGEFKKKLTVRAQAFSAVARSKIEAAGGVCEVIEI